MAKVIYTKNTYERHDWAKNEDGTIDYFAFENGFHNGPRCTRCSHSFCEHCDPDGYDEGPCIVEKWECPNCHKRLWPHENANFCCQCGEKLEWPK